MKTAACCCVLCAATLAPGQVKPAAGDPPPFVNTLGMKFVKVPGARPLFSVWETRVRDYRVFAEETRTAWTRPDFEQTPDDPVVNVSWDDAAAFCQWLTGRERKAGRLTDKQRYRLPTDAEWSAAAGLGAEQGRTPEDRLRASVVWPWGWTWPPQPGDGNYAPELEADQFANTSPVGSFKPNAQRLFDLGGNAWEWCEDWFNDARVTKALRGGSFHDSHPKDLLAAYRFSGTVHLSNDDIGFRMVLDDLSQHLPTLDIRK
jgi:formylglycine-generating enzyme required for sulfatase activity